MSSINAGMEPLESSAPITRSIEALKMFLPPGQMETPGYTNAPGTTSSSMEEFATPPNFATGSPYVYSSDEQSPYSIMDNILWGGEKHEGLRGF